MDAMDLEPVPGTQGVMQEYTLDGIPVHYREPCTHSHTHLGYHSTYWHVFWGGERKLENPDEYKESMQRNSTHSVTLGLGTLVL